MSRPESSHPAPVEAFAAVALDNVTTEFPYATQHVTRGPEDVVLPVALHPAFGTSFDWHSSVHMHWLLVSLLETEPAAGEGAAWREQAISFLSQHLSAENIAVESAYLLSHPTWERPYGWAWAAQLVAGLQASRLPQLRAVGQDAQPLLDAVFDLTLAWLPKVPEPVRHGLHTNTAFGLRRILLVAREHGRSDVSAAIEAAARSFFQPDAAWCFDQERSGQDFLSGGFCEADLMAEVLTPQELAAWLPPFLSELRPESKVLTPVTVLDPTDAYQSHLYGLGLTAATSILRLAPTLDADPTLRELAGALRSRVDALLAPGLEAAVSEEYGSSHWLATFAWEALQQRATPIS